MIFALSLNLVRQRDAMDEYGTLVDIMGETWWLGYFSTVPICSHWIRYCTYNHTGDGEGGGGL